MITNRTMKWAWATLSVWLVALLLLQGCVPIDYSELPESEGGPSTMIVEQFTVIDSEGLPRTCVATYHRQAMAISCDWELAP